LRATGLFKRLSSDRLKLAAGNVISRTNCSLTYAPYMNGLHNLLWHFNAVLQKPCTLLAWKFHRALQIQWVPNAHNIIPFILSK